MGKNKIHSDIKIITTIHKNWMFGHLDFMQGSDPLNENGDFHQPRMMKVQS